jgi:hypothetical protein
MSSFCQSTVKSHLTDFSTHCCLGQLGDSKLGILNTIRCLRIQRTMYVNKGDPSYPLLGALKTYFERVDDSEIQNSIQFQCDVIY